MAAAAATFPRPAAYARGRRVPNPRMHPQTSLDLKVCASQHSCRLGLRRSRPGQTPSGQAPAIWADADGGVFDQFDALFTLASFLTKEAAVTGESRRRVKNGQPGHCSCAEKNWRCGLGAAREEIQPKMRPIVMRPLLRRTASAPRARALQVPGNIRSCAAAARMALERWLASAINRRAMVKRTPN